jgi:sialate O-acetylesterase
MKARWLGSILALAALAAGTPAQADVKLPAVFSDQMVLQAGLAVPVFGVADPGEEVAVQFRGQTKNAVAGKDGKWQVRLAPLEPDGPFEMKIIGRNTLALKDVLVGEVWVASGQSNMRFPLANATGGKDEAAKANFPDIRYLRVGGRWQTCTPKTAGAFSAVAYHFAVALHRQRRVPVGIVDNSVSGELGQNFMSPAAFEADPELARMVHPHTRETSTQWARLVAPVIPYGIRGVLWYQGEGNRDYPLTYRRLLRALIADWRKHWGQGDFPFLVVQLANSQERRADPWEGKDCALREAQLKAVRETPRTALVVTIDLGIARDVHYPNKQPVGERLALAARALAYGEKITYSGPLFESAKFEAGKAIVSFTHVGGGLAARGDKLTGFLLCGADRKFHRAEARIEGDKVVVSSASVPAPVAVRYAWERNPECNLVNREGLPASPFRSDEFVNYFTRDGDR